MPGPWRRRGTLVDIDTDPSPDGVESGDGDEIPGFERPSAPPTRAPLPRPVWYAIGGLAVVIAIAVYFAGQAGTPSPLADGPGDGVIEALVPTQGAEVLQQGRFGIDLAPGWDATLIVNDVAIPDDQLQRIPELNQVFFVPGEDKVIERLPPGENCISARFFPSASGEEESQVRTWCFSVT
jgi:hypothetical protein